MTSPRLSPLTCLTIVMVASSAIAEDAKDESQSKKTPDEIIAEYNTQEIGGKRIPPIIDPKFRFPPAGTPIESIDGKELKIGGKLPPIVGQTMYGNDYTLRFSDEHKATLVVCWFSGCGPCLRAMPFENALLEKYKDRGFRIIAINSDATVEQAVRTARRQGIKWITLHDGEKGPIAEKLGVHKWPTLFLVDSRGVIIHTSPQLETWYFRLDPDTKEVIAYANQLTAALDKLFKDESKSDQSVPPN